MQRISRINLYHSNFTLKRRGSLIEILFGFERPNIYSNEPTKQKQHERGKMNKIVPYSDLLSNVFNIKDFYVLYYLLLFLSSQI